VSAKFSPSCRTNNPVLLSFVLSLSTHLEQKLVALLVIKILCTCPDLLLPFLKSFPHSFEPRPAKKYVVAMEFVLKVSRGEAPVICGG
jgi:hypothetical protein